MKKLFFLCAIVISVNSIAQNVGINITTPQATFDVRGSQRTGGINNYVKYDSATGKIEWVGAALFTPTSQQIIKHSASSEGLYAGGGKLDYRNSSGTPVFYSDWTNGNGYFSGRLGIGTVNPSNKLHIWDGTSGITPFFSARMVIETNNHTYINLLSPDPFETGILFGSGTNAVSGLISYNSTTVPKGFIFNNNGNQTRMVINNAGNVGFGTTNPQKNVSVQNGMNIDQADGNIGSLGNAITFGNNSGEGIASKRSAGSNQWGLDFYTNSTNKMSITNGGNVGIGTTTPGAKLHVSADDASLALFGPSSSGGSLSVGMGPYQLSTLTTQILVSNNNDLYIDPAPGKELHVGYYQANTVHLEGLVFVGERGPASLKLNVYGFTKLGGDAPSIKMKKLTGTTASFDGGEINIAHGLTPSKILSVSAMVSSGPDIWIGPNFGLAGFNFRWRVDGGNIVIDNFSGDSVYILSKPIKILITYEE